jgi:hypothetical protein
MEDQKIKKPKDPKYNNSPEYNKKYYASHKTEILSTLKTKCQCPDCGRTVSYARLNLHRKTDICLRNKKNRSNQDERTSRKTNQAIRRKRYLNYLYCFH